MSVSVDVRRPFVVAFLGLVALAWAGLWGWGGSPYGRFLDHEAIHHEASGDPALLLVFVAGWMVMVVAMMLPTSLPLVATFQALTRRRADRVLLVGLLLAGYLAVWTLFGLVVHLGDLRLHEAAHRSPWLAEHAWLIGAATLLAAGAYQFTPLKYHCLEKCRSPLSFVVEHWRGRRERLHALWLGVHHGLFCLGCCWSLMLLMFAVGVGSLGWMLVLGSVMAAEKNLPWGRRLSAPVGLALLGWGAAVVAVNLA